jgi:hypothetical protein
VVTAFDLVVWIAASAVTASADRGKDLEPFLLQPFEQAECGECVLDAGPDLIGIPHGDNWSITLRPGADDQASVVGICEGPETMIEVPKAATEVVSHDRAECSPNVLDRKQVTKSELVRPPLTIQLIGEAARSEAGDIRVVGSPEVLAVPEGHVVGVPGLGRLI